MSLGVVGFLVLVFLPGAWITFGLPLRGLPFWARLLIGIMLAPLIVCLQFYAIRLLGASFELTTTLLVGLNLVPLYLLYRQRGKFSFPDRNTIAVGAFVLLVILVCIAPFLFNAQKRLYTWEAWSQADVTYMVANGNLLLEDAELAGVRLSYPWAGHVYQAILSYLLDTPPVSNYIWTNLVWLLFIFSFAAGIVAELGGNYISRVTVAIWLSFGVNFVGGVLGQIVPAFMQAYPIWGDNRYTPWLDKVIFFGQMYFAMGIFIAILFLMIKQLPEGFNSDHLIVICLLLCGLGLIYPVLLPLAYVVIGAKAISILLTRSGDRPAISYRQIIGLGLVLLIAGVVSFTYLKFLTQGRTGEALISLNDKRFMVWRVVESAIVTCPLLVGFGLVMQRFWKERRNAIIILGLGALVSCILYAMFDIPWWRNEYKFIFIAAICLSPFPSLTLEPFIDRLGRMALPAIAALTLILAAPFGYNTYKNEDVLYTKAGPLADVRHFDLRLDDKEHLSGLYDTIRQRTPLNTLLVLENAELHFPTLTRRQLYVAPVQQDPHPGILITSDDMLTLVKGYSKQLLEDRRTIVRALFDSGDATQMEQSLNRILEFNRPLALVLDEQRQAALLGWLTKEKKGQSLYKGEGVVLWLVEPKESITGYRK